MSCSTDELLNYVSVVVVIFQHQRKVPTTCRLHDGGLRVKATSFSILTIMVRTERYKTPMRAGMRNRDKYVASGVLELAPVGTPAYARTFMVWNGRRWQKKHQSLLCGGFALSGLDVSYVLCSMPKNAKNKN